MSARHFAVARVVRTLLTPLVIALPPLFWVVSATDRASRTPLGRDQGIFQYVAWALGRGQVDYRDVRDVNGPLTHLVHVAFLALGGADDHRFRVLDLAVTGASFAFAGACVAGLGSRRAPGWPGRAAWALASWVVLSGQYLLFGYWDLAQRESFFDWFMLPSVALQLVAQAPPASGARRADGGARRQALGLGVVGALSLVPWFGKPTFALFTAVQLVAIAVDDELVLPRKKALLSFAVGGAIGATVVLGWLATCGDALAFLRIQLTDVPALYRFLWPRAAVDIFSDPWRATQAIFAIAGAIVLLSLVLLGEMPRAAIALALVPVCALASVVLQAKGFPYHFHPVTAGVHLQWLAFAAWLAERTRVARRSRALLRLAPIAVGLVLAYRVATAMEDSPHVRAVWLLWSGATSADRSTREYFAHFPEVDFFPFEMRQAAAYLREHTTADDRVQVYGMDPVSAVSRRTSQRDALHLRVRPRRRRGACGRHGRRAGRPPIRAHPRHSRRERDRPARQARGAAPRRVRLPRSVAAPLRGRRLGRFRGPLHAGRPLGFGALSRERALRPRPRLAASRSRPRGAESGRAGHARRTGGPPQGPLRVALARNQPELQRKALI